MMGTTIDLVEIIFTLVAAIVIGIQATNIAEARRDQAAVRLALPDDWNANLSVDRELRYQWMTLAFHTWILIASIRGLFLPHYAYPPGQVYITISGLAVVLGFAWVTITGRRERLQQMQPVYKKIAEDHEAAEFDKERRRH